MSKTLEQVRAEMGEAWALHPANRVKRRRRPLRDSAGTNLANTFRRVRREQAAALKREAESQAETVRKVAPIARRKP